MMTAPCSAIMMVGASVVVNVTADLVTAGLDQDDAGVCILGKAGGQERSGWVDRLGSRRPRLFRSGGAAITMNGTRPDGPRLER